MLFLITWASLIFNNPPLVQPSLVASDTVKRQERDSLSGTDTEPSQIGHSVQEQPSIRRSISHPSPRTEQRFQRSTIDTILLEDPTLRRVLLRNLFMPQVPFNIDDEVTSMSLFNQRLEQASKFTPFERMSLVAKRYSIYDMADQSLKSYQLDISHTIRWWFDEALK
jgi:hypothetical protein